MEVTPSAPTPKRVRTTRSKPAEATEAGAQTPAKKPATKRKKPPAAKPSTDEIAGMIAMAAYFIAKQRNFAPGHELDDWLQAEQQVTAMMS